jgi:hypothetical protein
LLCFFLLSFSRFTDAYAGGVAFFLFLFLLVCFTLSRLGVWLVLARFVGQCGFGLCWEKRKREKKTVETVVLTLWLLFSSVFLAPVVLLSCGFVVPPYPYPVFFFVVFAPFYSGPPSSTSLSFSPSLLLSFSRSQPRPPTENPLTHSSRRVASHHLSFNSFSPSLLLNRDPPLKTL